MPGLSEGSADPQLDHEEALAVRAVQQLEHMSLKPGQDTRSFPCSLGGSLSPQCRLCRDESAPEAPWESPSCVLLLQGLPARGHVTPALPLSPLCACFHVSSSCKDAPQDLGVP